MSEKKTAQLFDKYAKTYDQEVHKSLGGLAVACNEKTFFNKHKVHCIKRMVPGVECCRRILDYGCGTGGVMKELVKELPAAHITGFDISTDIMTIAKEQLYDQKNVEWITEPRPEEPFDLIILANVLHHVSPLDRISLLVQVRRCLSVNGIVVVFEHNPLNLLTLKVVRDCPFDKDAVLLNPSALVKCTNEAGFVEINTKYILYLPWIGFLPDMVESLMGDFPLGAQYISVFKQDTKAEIN